ncbi:hypothetical protein DAEQUDRAFT_173328 [Daedalea quercina L-15889]|uniref:DUF6533 domain-containing protein n=1 Tax=Daedalea quercina L-15889 TaxID=1314783 RepID=A0A165RC39_9APHY|nr:hypothetical protein DAEQUDRAFT_173328 [Daedalea quercina L-15889]
MPPHVDLNEEVVSAVYQQTLNVYCTVAAIVVLVYDYFLTFDHEVGLFWLRPKLSSANIIFAFSRVATLGYVIMASLDNPRSWTLTSCKGVLLASDLLVLLSYVIWAVLSASRVYALTHRRWSLAALTLVLGIVPAVMNAATISRSAYMIKSLGHLTFCRDSNSMNLAGSERYLLLVAPACAMISDMIVLLITLYCVRPCPRRDRWTRCASTRGLSHIVLRDGALYFVILTTLNAIQFILYLHTPTGFIDSFIAPVILVFVPRFLLNLQESFTGRAVVHVSDEFEMSSHGLDSRTITVDQTAGNQFGSA